MTDYLKNSAARLKQWCIQKALPLWEERAHLPDGSWVEHLTLDGTADIAAERRWRVLARQVYVYAETTRSGWYEGEVTARATYDKMQQTGYVQRVTSEGKPTERRRDLYDHTFFLLAASSLYRLTKKPEYLTEADKILTTIDRDFSHEDGGWRETPRGKLPRRQNPHMHLFEACLYLYATTQDKRHLDYARKIYKLFTEKFFDENHQRVREFFNNDWTQLTNDLGQATEPGHSMEWVWLLGQYEKASKMPMQSYIVQLYEGTIFGTQYFLNDEENIQGHVVRGTKRLWVQTELIKAHLTMAERQKPGASEAAAAIINGLFDGYLKEDGTWNDQLDNSGLNVAKTIPVSTFYHIISMATEAERLSLKFD